MGIVMLLMGFPLLCSGRSTGALEPWKGSAHPQEVNGSLPSEVAGGWWLRRVQTPWGHPCEGQAVDFQSREGDFLPSPVLPY